MHLRDGILKIRNAIDDSVKFLRLPERMLGTTVEKRPETLLEKISRGRIVAGEEALEQNPSLEKISKKGIRVESVLV